MTPPTDVPTVAEVRGALMLASGGAYIATGLMLARLDPASQVIVDRDSLWAALAGMGIIANGTWVSFQREDVDAILAALREQR